MPRVLIVEDEPRLAQLLADYLTHSRFQADQTASVREAERLVRAGGYQAVLLDLMLPDGDGMELCKTIRRFSQVPILMITARVEEVDRLLGLEIGADDYICKPFSPREVVARVKAVLRRSLATEQEAGSGLELDRHRFEAVCQSARVALTAIEFELLATLAKQPGRIWSRDQLMDVIYPDHRVVSDRTIDSHIRKLRRKLGEGLPGDHDWIGSVYGVGYRLQTRPEDDTDEDE
ncbi:response regulator receiver domain protein [Alloalcanivorax dieselolei B5]|uniref:Response regulator receiver domain protein n=1 Tax=Alcanivorax dieselolei (strain DSM 16502 / CGMCC 1.3690 / MCCC 1A00001 / B-5) TaxID=930169 RepID=K0CGJ7_ALCDB|nr:response regulator [Alloalcanivorax dieselolei]AFT71723.1 response regulator receiver domain protein [Alloalcanivorax dieselolei B5]GGK02954.1 DNA-binding response regulator [Alloalcanivorax dieselolei]